MAQAKVTNIITATRLPTIFDLTGTADSADVLPDYDGLWVVANWRGFDSGMPEKVAFEFPIYTDAHVTGYVTDGYGPYQFLNALPYELTGLRASIVVRASNHLFYRVASGAVSPQGKTDTTAYHGGDELDGIAALVSLALGIRTRAGNVVRIFEPGGDLRGRPQSRDVAPLAFSRQGKHAILPNTSGTVSLNDGLKPLQALPSTETQASIALMRAARLYQDAVWVAESQPELAWLFLVSAVETAANHWRREKETPVERILASKPDLATYLNAQGGEELLQSVANAIADSLGSAAKFRDFIIKFLPPPPEIRYPHSEYSVGWEEGDMKKSLSKIYGYRSKALHTGIPFPKPMCEPAIQLIDNLHMEKPMPTGQFAGSSWGAKDLPMHLWVFEYIARGALLNWWRSLTDAPAGTETAASTADQPPAGTALVPSGTEPAVSIYQPLTETAS